MGLAAVGYWFLKADKIATQDRYVAQDKELIPERPVSEVDGKLPDGRAYEVVFPETPVTQEIIGVRPKVEGQVFEDSRTGLVYVAWAWPLKPGERGKRSDVAIAAGYVASGTGLMTRERGGRVGYETYFARNPQQTRYTITDEWVHVQRVSGAISRMDDPRTVAFFESLRISNNPAPPPTAPPPEDELRPVTRIEPFLVCAFGTRTGSLFVARADLPPRPTKREIRNPPEPMTPSKVTLTRHDSTSFKPLREYALSTIPFVLVLDEERRRVYVAGHRPEPKSAFSQLSRGPTPADIQVYELPEDEENAPEKLEPITTIPVGLRLRDMVLSPDGKHLFCLAGNPATERTMADKGETTTDMRALKIDTDALENPEQLPLAPGTHSMCLVPNGRFLYAAAAKPPYVETLPSGGSLRPRDFGVVQQIDPVSWKVTRKINIWLSPRKIVAGPNGKLCLISTNWEVMGVDPTVAGEPMIRRILVSGVLRQVGMVGRRLYIGSSEVRSFDTRELFEHGRTRVIGDVQDTKEFPVSGTFTLSPDGKYLVTRSGSVFSLTNEDS